MILIYDDELFLELQENPEWETLWDYNQPCYPELKNQFIPVLCGGLSHIEKTSKSVIFYDIGCNEKDNSFSILSSQVR